MGQNVKWGIARKYIVFITSSENLVDYCSRPVRVCCLYNSEMPLRRCVWWSRALLVLLLIIVSLHASNDVMGCGSHGQVGFYLHMGGDALLVCFGVGVVGAYMLAGFGRWRNIGMG